MVPNYRIVEIYIQLQSPTVEAPYAYYYHFYDTNIHVIIFFIHVIIT